MQDAEKGGQQVDFPGSFMKLIYNIRKQAASGSEHTIIHTAINSVPVLEAFLKIYWKKSKFLVSFGRYLM